MRSQYYTVERRDGGTDLVLYPLSPVSFGRVLPFMLGIVGLLPGRPPVHLQLAGPAGHRKVGASHIPEGRWWRCDWKPIRPSESPCGVSNGGRTQVATIAEDERK
jgi:hypothetical protein